MVSNRPKRKAQHRKTTVSKSRAKKSRTDKSSSAFYNSSCRLLQDDDDIPEMPENPLADCFGPTVVKAEIVEEENANKVSSPTNFTHQSSSSSVKPTHPTTAFQQPENVPIFEILPTPFETDTPMEATVKTEAQEEFNGYPFVQIIQVQPLPMFMYPPVQSFFPFTFWPMPIPIVPPLPANYMLPTMTQPPRISTQGTQPVTQKTQPVTEKTQPTKKKTQPVTQETQPAPKSSREKALDSIHKTLSKLQNWESALLPAKYFLRWKTNQPIRGEAKISVVKIDLEDGKASTFYQIFKSSRLEQIYLPSYEKGALPKRSPSPFSSFFEADVSSMNKISRQPDNVVSQECLADKPTSSFPNQREALAVSQTSQKQRIRSQFASKISSKILPVTASKPVGDLSVDINKPHSVEPGLNPSRLQNTTSPFVSGLPSASPRPLVVGKRLILRPLSQMLSSTGKIQIPLRPKQSDLPPGTRMIPNIPTFFKKRITNTISKKYKDMRKAARNRMMARESFQIGHSRFGRQIRMPTVLDRSQASLQRERYRCLMSVCLKFPKRQTNPLVLIGDLHRDFKEWVEKVENYNSRTEAEWRLLFDVKRGLTKPRNKNNGGRPLKKHRGRGAKERNKKRKEHNEARREEVQTTYRESPALTKIIADSQYTSNGTFIVQETVFDTETFWDVVSTVADLVAFTSFRMSRPATGQVAMVIQRNTTKHHKSQLYYS